MMSFFLFSFLSISQLAPTTALPEGRALSSDIDQLDAARLRKSLETTYGEYATKRISEWQVAIQGRTEVWKWNGEKFECPKVSGPEILDCNQWVPASFHWFVSGRQWLEPWVSMRRQGFFLGRPEAKSRPVDLPIAEVLSEEEEVPADDTDEEVTEEWSWDGKRLASRVWEWVNQNGESAKIFVSLRNGWIERLDPDAYSAEYIEWKKENRWSKPSLSKVVLDKNGIRISFQHLRNLKK